MPAPVEAWEYSDSLGRAPFDHYADLVWDTVRMNNILQHFATAFMDLHLKDETAKGNYLDLVENAADGVWSMDETGQPADDHSYWMGFADRTAKGLRFKTVAADQ